MNTQSITEQIAKDFKVLTRDAEELALSTASEMSETVRDARARLAEAIASIGQNGEGWGEKTKREAKAAGRIVEQHPFTAAVVALGVGVLAGVLIAAKRTYNRSQKVSRSTSGTQIR